MTNEQREKPDEDQPMIYQIRVRGHLNQQRMAWVEGLTVSFETDDSSLLAGPIVDQAALHGLLKKLRDLGIPLLSVNAVDPTALTILGTESDNMEQ